MKKKALSIALVMCSLATVQAQHFGWAASMGSSSSDQGYAITVDPSGNVIAVGNFSGTADFDPSAATQNLSSLPGGTGLFITKMSSTGTTIWARSFDGTSAYNFIRAVDTDASGNVYVTGEFGGVTDFDPSPSTFYTLSPTGQTDIFVAKLDASGNFAWAFKLGGITNAEYGTSIAVDAAGNVHVTGAFSQTIDFDPSATTKNLASVGGSDVFIAKYTSAGSYVWANRIGGGGGTWGSGIAVDAGSNVFITGWFNGTADLDPAAATTSNYTSVGQQDTYVAKLDASGNLVWAKQIGGADRDAPTAIALDASSNVYLTGSFAATTDFDPSASVYTLTSTGGQDIFVTKLDASGAFMWAHAFGSSSSDNNSGEAIAVSAQGNVYTTGGFYQLVDFDPSAAVNTLSSKGGIETFVLKLDASGNFGWVKQLGSTSYDLGHGITVDASENVYTTGGFFDVVDYDPAPATSYTLASTGLYDIFISKLTSTDPGTTVGIQDNTNEETLVNVYPNPAANLLTITTRDHKNTAIVIYDVNGRQVLKQELNSASLTLPVGQLSEGVYQLVLLRDQAPVYQAKWIKSATR